MNRRWWLVGLTMTQMLMAVSTVGADLGYVTFDEFLKGSSLILIARSVEAAAESSGSGRARLEVVRVLRGRYAEPSIKLEWSGKEDEQRILEVDREYVLFLRKAGDRYVAAEYGMSYWLLTYT